MAGNVVGLNGRPAGSMEPVETCVNALRDLLERAEAGELIGVALAGLHHDGDASYHVAGRVSGFGLQGALEVAKAKLVDINRGKD